MWIKKFTNSAININQKNIYKVPSALHENNKSGASYLMKLVTSMCCSFTYVPAKQMPTSRLLKRI